MYSVKPGRGPSLMGALVLLVFIVPFGIFFAAQSSKMGAPAIFPVFGIGFVILGIVGAVYNVVNATNSDRMSTIDITTGEEEGDILAEALGHHIGQHETPVAVQAHRAGGEAPKFCPYCGEDLQADYEFCPQCGKDI